MLVITGFATAHVALNGQPAKPLIGDPYTIRETVIGATVGVLAGVAFIFSP